VISSDISFIPSVPDIVSSPAHSAPIVTANAFTMDIVLENIGDLRPPAAISAAVLFFVLFFPAAHTHWKRSITCLIIDDGPEKYTGVEMTMISLFSTA